MRRTSCLLAFTLALVFLAGCASKPDSPPPAETNSKAIPEMPIKIRVADVANDTKDLFDVDVIGLLWNALDDSLLRKGYLWLGNSPTPPLNLEVHILKYRKGNAIARSCLPYFGNTELAVKCDLKDGDRLIGSVETKHTINLKSGGFASGAWKRVFADVGEDIISQVARKM